MAERGRPCLAKPREADKDCDSLSPLRFLFSLLGPVFPLCGLLFLPPLSAAAGTLQPLGGSVYVTTRTLRARFDRGSLAYAENRLTGERYTLDGPLTKVTALFAAGARPAWADDAPDTRAESTGPGELTWRFRGYPGGATLTERLRLDGDDVLVSLAGAKPGGGISGLLWSLGNLNLGAAQPLLPVYGGISLDRENAPGWADWYYPGWEWEAQLALIQGRQGGLAVWAEDPTGQPKTLHFRRRGDRYSLGLQTQMLPPWKERSEAASVVWRLRAYAGDWQTPAAAYRRWMASAFSLRPREQSPPWVTGIGLMVKIPAPPDPALLPRLAQLTNPSQTLLYCPMWRRYPFDVNYPDYVPAPRFADFVAAAHRLGFRVMIHVNLLQLTPGTPVWKQVEPWLMHDPNTGEGIGWRWGAEGGNVLGTINPASARLRAVLIDRIRQAVRATRADAVHLDVNAQLSNGSDLVEGLTPAQGLLRLQRDLAAALPAVAFSGEGLTEISAAGEQFAQAWLRPRPGTGHPISAFLFSPYVRYYGHLGLANPDLSPTAYLLQKDILEAVGAIPTLSVQDAEELAPDRPGALRVLAEARFWQAHRLRPDWGPLPAEVKFRYRGADGVIATCWRRPYGVEFGAPGVTIYRTVHGVSAAEVAGTIPSWLGYDGRRLIGLDPRAFYPLLSERPDLSQPHLVRASPGVYLDGGRTTTDYARFRIGTVGPTTGAVRIAAPREPRAILHGEHTRVREVAPGEYEVVSQVPATVSFIFGEGASIPADGDLMRVPYRAWLVSGGMTRPARPEEAGGIGGHDFNGMVRSGLWSAPPDWGRTEIDWLLKASTRESVVRFFGGLQGSKVNWPGRVMFWAELNSKNQFFADLDRPGWVDGQVAPWQPSPYWLLTLVTDAAGEGTADWAVWGAVRAERRE